MWLSGDWDRRAILKVSVGQMEKSFIEMQGPGEVGMWLKGGTECAKTTAMHAVYF